MRWFWSDDLAAMLLHRGLVQRGEIEGWIRRPWAVPGPPEADPIQVAEAQRQAERRVA